MTKFCRAAIIAVVLLCVGGGVAAADPVPLRPVGQQVTTEEGYNFSVSLTEMTVNSVPNMAATAFTREAFVSARAEQLISGTGTYPVSGGKLEMALQLGCQIDLSQGGSITFGADSSFNLSTTILPNISDLIPNVTVNLRPGTTKYTTIGKETIIPDGATAVPEGTSAKKINAAIAAGGGALRLKVHDAYVTVDGCGGPVSARVVAVAQLRTEKGTFDELNLYGDIMSI